MTAKERILASRLIEKIERQESYAKKIGISGRIVETDTHLAVTKNVSDNEKQLIK